MSFKNGFSQTDTPVTADKTFISSVSFYYEIMGSGITNSVNLELRFGKEESGIGVRAGFGYFYFENASYSSIPVAINFVARKDRNKLELGIGATFYHFSEDQFIFDNHHRLTYSYIVMYRYQPEEEGVLIRAGFTPMVGVINGGLAFFPFIGGVSIGYRF